MNLKDERGSIMLETAVVLPILVLIIFFIIQITFVWTAKQMTYYAAYCGARAALVYNPADYNAIQRDDGSWATNGFIRRGVVHRAACTVLSWVSWSLAGYDQLGMGTAYSQDDSNDFSIGSYQVPLSGNVKNQVAVKVSEYEKIDDESDDDNGGGTSQVEKTPIHQQFPAVTVTVAFRCPLFIPLGGPVMAYFFGANDDVCIPIYEEKDGEIVRDSISLGGFNAYNGRDIHNHLADRGNYTEVGNVSFYSMVLTESCTMAKPYKTDTYPMMSPADKVY